MSEPLDTSVPALVLKMHHGSLGIARSLGRLGNAAPTLGINDAGAMVVYARGGTDAVLRSVVPGVWTAVACEGQPTPLGGTYRTLRRNVRIGNDPGATIAFVSTVTLPGPDPTAVFGQSTAGAFVVAAENAIATGGETILGWATTAVAASVRVTVANRVRQYAGSSAGSRPRARPGSRP